LSCRYAAEILIVRSFDHLIVHRSFIVPIHRSFIVPIHRSFIVPIHRSSFVHTTIYHHYSPLLFTVTIHHRYYLLTIFTIVTLYRHYSSSLLFINDIYNSFSIVTIHCYYSLLLFIDHPLAPNFNYSSIMLSSPPKPNQTHIPVIRTPVTMIFLSVGNFPSGHSSQVSPS
jgi:hypothetical protein